MNVLRRWMKQGQTSDCEIARGDKTLSQNGGLTDTDDIKPGSERIPPLAGGMQ
jgi:hypothetical protein